MNQFIFFFKFWRIAISKLDYHGLEKAFVTTTTNEKIVIFFNRKDIFLPDVNCFLCILWLYLHIQYPISTIKQLKLNTRNKLPLYINIISQHNLHLPQQHQFSIFFVLLICNHNLHKQTIVFIWFLCIEIDNYTSFTDSLFRVQDNAKWWWFN